MTRTRNFDSLEDYKRFLEKEKKCSTEIGRGGEGICYLSDSDNQVYKLITKYQLKYDIDKIDTEYDKKQMEKLFAGYVNARLDQHLAMLK